MASLWSYLRAWWEDFSAKLFANREAARIALEIHPRLWEDVRRKIPGTGDRDLQDYIQLRAAQLAQPRVDALLLEKQRLSGVWGSLLVLRTVERALQAMQIEIARVKGVAA